MFLKSLTLRGFKTFADRVDLVFADACGLTAIVGPNGCGKSNIVDAFRFALGEGNLHKLRVNTVPEVIFAGTTQRKQLSLAEVTLLIDNSERKLPIDYVEVMVRRRTFRDGQSEFTINNQACRLKDIRDLLLDTGLSTESLSIIGQGRVDVILSSKPEDRRVVFEEVAGVLKYKLRKEEVGRKLISTEQNLLRISDLKVEIGEQALVLEKQAAKAREYKEIQNKLFDMEKALIKKQILSILQRKEESDRRMSVLKDFAKKTDEIKQKMQEEKLKILSSLRAVETEIDGIQSNIDGVNEKIEKERSSSLIGHERALYAEKEKVRDLMEDERFKSYEAKKLNDEINVLLKKKQEIQQKINEWIESSSYDFKDLKPVVQDLLSIIKQLNELSGVLCGKGAISIPSQNEDKVLNMFKNEIQKLEKEEIALSELKNARNSEVNKVREQLSYLKEELKKIEEIKAPQESETVKALAKEKNDLIQKIIEIKHKREELQKELEKVEGQGEQKPEENGELLKEELLQAKISGELEQLLARLQSEYSLSMKELLDLEIDLSIVKSRKEIEELRMRLRELEPVNLLAIDEYEKVRDRHTFIENQYLDLTSARENLKTLMVELDVKAREDFVATMEVVSKTFSEVFASLFEGGEAKIELEKDKDPLDAGIEIMVCPSGRKWLNLSLLSGGERSLTAIAILFSCLRTRPSPLCILDEVDAALDDSNVVRLANFLKEYKRNTQIVMITHNKRSMEVADVIYGVTMQEPGVSKLISMKLEKV